LINLYNLNSDPAPLSLRRHPEADMWADAVVNWLVAVVSSSSKSKASEAVQKKSVTLLMRLIVQRASLLTALKTAQLLSSIPQGTIRDDLRKLFDQLGKLNPVVDLNACLSDQSPEFLGNWRFTYPNHQAKEEDADLEEAEAEKKKAEANLMHRRRYGMVRGDEEAKAASKAPVSPSALTCDGSYLYVHSENGLAKVGTGYGDTRRGHVYAFKADWHKGETGGLAYVNGRLYYRSQTLDKKVIVMNADNLDELESVTLPDSFTITKDSPLISCPQYIYLIVDQVKESKVEDKTDGAKQDEGDIDYDMVVLDPANKFAIVRRISLGRMESLSKVQRCMRPCTNCHRFNYKGRTHMGNGSEWCDECDLKGYNSHLPSALMPQSARTEEDEYPIWTSPTTKGVGPSPRFGMTASHVIKVEPVVSTTKALASPKGDDDDEKAEKKTKEAVKEYGNFIYCFGGASGQMMRYQSAPVTIDMQFNDIYLYNIDTSTWSTPANVTGEPPIARLGHTANVVKDGKILIFGGGKDDSGDTTYNDTYIFDTVTNEWSKQTTVGVAPEGRVFHTSTLIGNLLYVYGGKGNKKIFNDLHTLDITNWTWNKVKTTGKPAPNKWGHIAVYYDDTLWFMGGGILPNQPMHQPPTFKLDLSIDMKAAPADRKPKYSFDIVSQRNGNYHVWCGSAYGVKKDKIFVFGGGQQQNYYQQVTVFDMKNLRFPPPPSISGTSPNSLGQIASVFVDGKIFMIGGVDQMGSKNSLYILDTSADPHRSISSAGLKEGMLYTNGAYLSLVLPPLVSPNVVLSNVYMTRVFSLKDGTMVADVDAGANVAGHASCYDATNNVIWTYDRNKHMMRRWANTGPAPATGLITDGKTAAAPKVDTEDLSLVLLAHLDRWATITMPGSSTFDPRQYRDGQDQPLNEPFCLEITRETFQVLSELLTNATNAAFAADSDATKNAQVAIKSLTIALRLLSLNTHRLLISREFTLQEIDAEAKVGALSTRIFTTLTSICDKKFTGALANSGASFHRSAFEALIIGLPLFVTKRLDRISWLKKFFDTHIPLKQELAADKQAVLQIVSERLALDPQASFNFLEPAGADEGTLPLRIVRADKKDEKDKKAKDDSKDEKTEDDDQSSSAGPKKKEVGPEALFDEEGPAYITPTPGPVDIVIEHARRATVMLPTKMVVKVKSANEKSSLPLPPGLPQNIRINDPMAAAAAAAKKTSQPVANGLLFALNTNTPEDLEKLKVFNDMNAESYEAFVKKKEDSKAEWSQYDPIAFFNFDDVEKRDAKNAVKLAAKLDGNEDADDDENEEDEPEGTRIVKINPVNINGKKVLRAGKFFVIKLLRAMDEKKPAAGASSSSSSSSSSSKADKGLKKSKILVQYIGIHGEESDPETTALPSAALLERQESKKDVSASLSLLQLLVDRTLIDTENLLNVQTKGTVIHQRALVLLRLLQSFQASLLSRTAHCSQPALAFGADAPKPKDGAEDYAKFSKAPPSVLTLAYTEYLFESSTKLLTIVAKSLASLPAGDEKKLSSGSSAIEAKIDQLSKSFLRVLLPPLLTALYHFASDLSFVYRILPSATGLLQAFDSLSANAGVRSFLAKFEEGYLLDEKARLNKYSATLLSGTDYACSACDHKATTAAEIETHLKEKHAHVVAEKTQLKTHWLLELQRTLGSFGGKCAATLTQGSPVSTKELEQSKWLNASIFSAGLEAKLVLRTLKGQSEEQRGANPWETVESVEKQLRNINTVEQEQFFDLFLGKPKPLTVSKEEAARSGAHLLSMVRLKGNRGSVTAQLPCVVKALTFVRAALIKHLGLSRDAMTYARVLATQHVSTTFDENIGLVVAPNSMPSNLRKVWTTTGEISDWMTKTRQELFQISQNKSDAKAEAAAAAAKTESKAEKDGKSTDAPATPAPAPVAAAPSTVPAEGKTEEKKKEKTDEFYEDLSRAVVRRAKFLLKIASRFAPTTLAASATTDDLLKPAGAPTVPGPPGLIRATSTIDRSSQAAQQARDAKDSATAETVGMWKSIAARAAPGLSRQASIGAPASSAGGLSLPGVIGKSGTRVFSETDVLMQFLKSDIEIDPAAQAAADKAKAKKKGAAVVDAIEEEEQPIKFNAKLVEKFLMLRRGRALARIMGFQYFFKLASNSSYLSVQHEILRYLGPALRGTSGKEQAKEPEPVKGPDGKIEDAPPPKPMKPFHYSDNTQGAGSILATSLNAAFRDLFGKLGTALKQQVMGIVPSAFESSSSPTTAQGAAVAASGGITSFDHLCLAILACWGMKFDHGDHMFLDQCGVIHLIRKLMEMVVPPVDKRAKPKAGDDKKKGPELSSRQRLKEAAWATFRLLALAGFDEETPSAVTVKRTSVKSDDHKDLTKFQVSIIELTFSIIRGTADIFFAQDAKRREEEAEQAKIDAEKKTNAPARSSPSSSLLPSSVGGGADDFGGPMGGFGRPPRGMGGFGGPGMMPPGAVGFGGMPAGLSMPMGMAPMGGRGSPAFGGPSPRGGAEELASPTNVEEKDDSAVPEETCFGMLRLVLSICGPSTASEKGESVDELTGEAESKEEDNGVVDAVMRYLSSQRFLPLLFNLLQSGTPRLQRMAIRLMRRLLPLQAPEALPIPAEAKAKGVAVYFIDLIGRLLVTDASILQSEDASEVGGKAKNGGRGGATGQMSSSTTPAKGNKRSAQVSFGLASDLIALVRILFPTRSEWTETLKSAVLAALRPIPELIKTGVKTESEGLRHAMAALCIIGGLREVIRVGGKVQVFSANNRKKRKLATLLAYDPIATTAKVVYDAVTSKKVESLSKGTALVAVEEVAFDPSLLPLTGDNTKHVLDSFLAVLSSSIPTTTDSKIESGNETLVVGQLKSRANRALWTLLQHKPSVAAVLRAGFGPKLTSVARSQTTITIGDPNTGKLEDTERHLERITEIINEARLSYSLPVVQTGKDDFLLKQPQLLPFSPYKSVPFKLPSHLVLDNQSGILEDDEKTVLVSTGRVQAWNDHVPAWSDIPIPPDLPSFYFEMTLVERGNDGPVYVGILSASKPKKQNPGTNPGSYALGDDGSGMHEQRRTQVEFEKGKESFWSKGDVLGVLLDKVSGQLSFTKNGILKSDVYLVPVSKSTYFPAVGLGGPGQRVSVNFGQRPFRWKYAESKYVPKEFRVGDLRDEDEADDDEPKKDTKSTPSSSKSTLASRGRPQESKDGDDEKKSDAKKAPSAEEDILLKKKAAALAEEAKKEDKKTDEKKGAPDGGDEKKGEDGKENKEAKANEGKSDEKKADEAKTEDEPTGSEAFGRGGGRMDDGLGDDESRLRENFDPWASEDEFSDDGGEEPNSDDEAEEDEYYGRRRQKKAVVVPLTADQITPGMVLMIVDKKDAEPEAPQDPYGFNPPKKEKKKEKKEDVRAGTVVGVDAGKRKVCLQFYNPETASTVHEWHNIAEVAKRKVTVNGDLLEGKDGTATDVNDKQAVLKSALDAESCLGVTYTRNALLAVLSQWPSLMADSEVKVSINDLGGEAALLDALKRAALDEFSELAASGGMGDDEVETGLGASGISGRSVRPLDVFRKFFLHSLRRKRSDSKVDSDQRTKLSTLLKGEAVAQLGVAKGSSKNWKDRLRSREHIEFGCWLVDLLLTADAIPKARAAAAAPVEAPAESLPGTVPVYDLDVYEALIAIITPAKKMKDFKPSPQVQLVIPLLSRLLSRLDLFPIGQYPDLTKLDWLNDRMKTRYALEVKINGANTAVSKPLQAIVNLLLVVKTAADVKKKLIEEQKKSDEAKTVAEDDLSVGADPEKLSWFEQTSQVAQIMRQIESGVGVPQWFVRASFVEKYNNDKSVTQESSAHPYSTDLAWTEIVVPHAQSLTVRIDAKSSTDSSDKLRFAVPGTSAILSTSSSSSSSSSGSTSSSSAVSGTSLSSSRSSGREEKGAPDGDDEKKATPAKKDDTKDEDKDVRTEVANFSGRDFASSGVGVVINQDKKDTFTIPGNRIWVQFEQSPAPVHNKVFCSVCERPIKGYRYVCGSCDGNEGQEMRGFHHGGRNNRGYNLCEACEKNNMDTGRHDRAHIFIQFRRPLPQNTNVPRVVPQLSALYDKDVLRKIRSGEGVDERPTHTGINCVECKKEVVGVRYRCSVCPEYDSCETCESKHIHERSHPLFKIRHPVKMSTGFKGVLKAFVDSHNEGGQFWGWRFTVKPAFGVSHQQDVLRDNKAALTAAVVKLSKLLDASTNVATDQQVVELVNRAVNRVLSIGKEDDEKEQINFRRGGGRAQPRRQETKDDALLPLLIEQKDVVPDRKTLVVYSLLGGLEIDEVLMRLAVLRLLNGRLFKVLPLIDWSMVRQSWSLSYVFGKLRGLVFSQMKMNLWKAALLKSMGRNQNRRQAGVMLDNHKAQRARDGADELDVLDVIDGSMFGQMFSQLRRAPAAGMRTPSQPWRVRYKSESGIDAGGLFRDSLTQVCTELQSPHIPLFIPCPNARHGVGITLDKYMPNRSCDSDIFISMYEFVGRMMGVAIRTNNPLSLDLPSMLWKPMVGMELEEGDLVAIDNVLMNAMTGLLDDEQLAGKGVTKENFEEMYPFTFTYSSSDERIVELKEGGRNVNVTWDNRAEYVKLVKEFRLYEIDTQVAAIRRGLISIIPARFLSLLTWKELELEVCGSPEIDIELLKQNTKYTGCSASDQHIIYFWTVLEKFSQLERAQYLRFAWGRSRLPTAAKFTDKMKIDSSADRSVHHLPLAHTVCYLHHLSHLCLVRCSFVVCCM
jgi:N-acetylneuraminic acid mutarotase